jgi:hypothetical protein
MRQSDRRLEEYLTAYLDAAGCAAILHTIGRGIRLTGLPNLPHAI